MFKPIWRWNRKRIQCKVLRKKDQVLSLNSSPYTFGGGGSELLLSKQFHRALDLILSGISFEGGVAGSDTIPQDCTTIGD